MAEALAVMASSPADYERLGLSPASIAPWEDGARTDDSPGTYEWWYFDAHLADGAKLVVAFMNKDIATPHKPLSPLQVVHDWYWARGQAGPYSVIASYITAAKEYGFEPIPIFMLARDNAVIGDDPARVTFERDGVYIDQALRRRIPALRRRYRDHPVPPRRAGRDLQRRRDLGADVLRPRPRPVAPSQPGPGPNGTDLVHGRCALWSAGHQTLPAPAARHNRQITWPSRPWPMAAQKYRIWATVV